MNRLRFAPLAGAAAMLLAACSSVETVKPPVPTLETKEMVYATGHRFYTEQNYDSAAFHLKRAAAMDPMYRVPVDELAEMYYTLGVTTTQASAKREYLKQSQQYFAKVEGLGQAESELYERLCELSAALDDHKSFLKYAKKNAEAFPYDRQYFNLGLAYFNVGDYQSVIKTQREATEKFKTSHYVGSFYKQLGRAYMKVDRDQTAQRTFEAGLQIVATRIAELRKSGGEYRSSDAYRRLADDRVDILRFLKKLYETYGQKDKLEVVERQLKEAGYSK